VFHVQPMQQRDQPGPGLILDAAFLLDPGARFAGGAGKGRGDSGLQLTLLFDGQPAGATFVSEAREPLDPVSLMLLVPRPDRVIIDKQDPGSGLTAHPAIQP
jgi:hypothetical protein